MGLQGKIAGSSSGANHQLPYVIMYDNAPATLSSLRKALGSGFKIIVRNQIHSFAQTLANIKEQGGTVAFVVLDMHDKRVRTLENIQLPTIETQEGTAVGLALTEHFLWIPEQNFGYVPVLLYSAKNLPADAKVRLQKKEKQGLPIAFASKGDDVSDIVNKMTSFESIAYDELINENEQEEISTEDYLEILTSHQMQASQWGFSLEDINKMFGYFPEQFSSIEELLHKTSTQPSFDIDSRINLLLDFRAGLDAIVGFEDFNLQKKWLSEKQRKFANKSAKDLLTSGNMEDLFALAYFMRDRVR